MEKQLRSLLHEKFDLDLRVEIEFLSRRRDLVNQEKQEELIKLLQSRNISNIVPLGPGTNRYAFKLDGFVIKVATDHDGKIDNLKEFKMAKRLYPYVTKTYEVSENGTMLVAEYIQPFESYTEMCKYADKIRAILEKLSSVYLIGDVGITPNNFANWGLRVGTEDPVCLDFAYVYEVSSKLFLCQYCTAHAMLVPNRDFTELHCSNPACGRRYLFEDIRTKIGNDIHNHEIGDLSLEGYKLFSSGVLTELTEDRSNYLVKKKTKKEIVAPVIEEVPFVDNFVMEQPLSTIKGGNNMSRIENAVKVAATLAAKPAPGVLRVQATAMPSGFKQPAPQAPAPTQVISEDPKPVMPEEASGLGGLKRAQAVVINNGSEEMPKDVPMPHPPLASTLAFQGTMTGSAEPVPQAEKMPVPPAPTPAPAPATPAVIVGEMHANLMQQRPEPVKATASIAVPATAVPVQAEEEPEAEPEVQQQPQDNGAHQFDVAFRSSVRNVISQLSNRIGYQMGQDEIYEAVHNSIRDKKMYKRTFYENCQSAVFRSLVKFLGFTEEQKPKTSGSGTRHVFTPPEDLNGEHEGTFIFLERLWKDDLMNKFGGMGENVEMMDAYRATYSDHQGIERGWLDELAARINTKMPVDIIGAKQIAQLVAPLWCVPEAVEQEEPKDPDPQPDQNTGAEAQPEAEARKYTKEEILFAIKNIFDEPDNDDFREILDWISGSDPANDWIMIQQALTEFGMRNYKAPLLIEDPKNVALMKFSVTVGDNVWEFARMINAETYGTWDTVDNSDVPIRVEQIKTVVDAIIFLACMDIQGVVDGYSAQVESIIDHNRRAASHAMYGASGFSAEMTPAEAAAQILQSAQEEDDEDDEEEEYQTLAVHIFNDETFDIIKVSSGEAFGDVSIPFYTKLDKVSLEGGVPSIVDERNGIWDWMIHMVPDIVFQTKDPDHFMKDINVIEEGGQVKIVILDNDHGTYTMGLFWLSGVFIVDDEGNEEICTDPEILAKINRVIREDIGYGRISHLQRTLSMDSLVHDEAYVEEIIEQIDQEKKASEAEEGGEGMEPEALNAAEAAAMRVIMGGAAALPDDATPKQKEFAEEVHKQAFAGLGVPTPEEMAGEAPKEEPVGDMGIPEEPAAPPAEEPAAEETFEMNVPPAPAPAAPAPQAAPLPVVKKGSDSGDQGMTLPVRRRHH